MMVLRDVMLANRRVFSEIAAQESIAINNLTNRLERLLKAGILERVPDPTDGRRHRYVPTEIGLELIPVLLNLMVWGNKHTFGSGPQHFSAEEWENFRSDLQEKPLIFGLPHLFKQTGMDGVFGWPPVHGGKEVSPEVWGDYLRRLEQHSDDNILVINTAFYGFKDIYKQANLHDSYGFIDPRNGMTLKETLGQALASNAQAVQIATWNDYGEGTGIEPSRDAGYERLEIVQQYLMDSPKPEHLRIPDLIYQARKRYAGNEELQNTLDQLSGFLLTKSN